MATASISDETLQNWSFRQLVDHCGPSLLAITHQDGTIHHGSLDGTCPLLARWLASAYLSPRQTAELAEPANNDVWVGRAFLAGWETPSTQQAQGWAHIPRQTLPGQYLNSLILAARLDTEAGTSRDPCTRCRESYPSPADGAFDCFGTTNLDMPGCINCVWTGRAGVDGEGCDAVLLVAVHPVADPAACPCRASHELESILQRRSRTPAQIDVLGLPVADLYFVTRQAHRDFVAAHEHGEVGNHQLEAMLVASRQGDEARNPPCRHCSGGPDVLFDRDAWFTYCTDTPGSALHGGACARCIYLGLPCT
jgi:hypothetical protein